MKYAPEELAKSMQGVTDENTPPLARWLIACLAAEFRMSKTCAHLNLCVRSVPSGDPNDCSEPDALFSLCSSTTDRSADVWVDWGGGPDRTKSIDVHIVISDNKDEATARCVYVQWSPAQLVAWLDGEA